MLRLARFILGWLWAALSVPLSATANVLPLFLLFFSYVLLIPVTVTITNWAAATIRRGS